MALYRGLEALGQISADLHLAIGVFDGVHLGHQQVIQTAQQAAAVTGGSVVVLTFEPHPIRVLAPERAPRMLASLEHKVQMLAQIGVDQVVVLPFTAEFALVSAEEFVEQLKQATRGNLRSVAVGLDWRFGAQAKGNVELLAQGLGAEVDVVGVQRVLFAGERVSSTRVRAAIQDGNLELASALLGREYTVLGTVIYGNQLGRKIGYPTANLRCHSEQLPPSGVYVVKVKLPDGSLAYGAANLGLRPTVEAGQTQRRLEVHVFDFNGDLYHQDLEVAFLSFLRAEMSFDGVEQLTAQIAKDVVQARAFLA